MIINKLSLTLQLQRRMSIAVLYQTHSLHYSLLTTHDSLTLSRFLRFATNYVVVDRLCPKPNPHTLHTKQRHTSSSPPPFAPVAKEPWALEISRRYVARALCQCAPWWVLRILFRIAGQASRQSATLEALNWPTPSSSRLQPISYTCWPWAWRLSWCCMCARNLQLSVRKSGLEQCPYFGMPSDKCCSKYRSERNHHLLLHLHGFDHDLADTRRWSHTSGIRHLPLFRGRAEWLHFRSVHLPPDQWLRRFPIIRRWNKAIRVVTPRLFHWHVRHLRRSIHLDVQGESWLGSDQHRWPLRGPVPD